MLGNATADERARHRVNNGIRIPSYDEDGIDRDRINQRLPNWRELAAVILVLALLVALGTAARQMASPWVDQAHTISLSPGALPLYALRTTVRMLIALVASLLFSVIYATIAAKSARAEMVLIPLLDVLQSVPILGYLSFTVVFFIRLFPRSALGPECAAIFAIFTSQAWNMAFSFYQSLRTVPRDHTTEPDSHRLGDPGHDRDDRFVRSAAVPADGRLGGEVSRRADGFGRRAMESGARTVSACEAPAKPRCRPARWGRFDHARAFPVPTRLVVAAPAAAQRRGRALVCSHPRCARL